MLSHGWPILHDMPLPPPTVPDDRRRVAERARRARTLRVGRLRRQVLAVALGTFALAFGVVAFDGSMGAQTASSAASSRSGAAVSGSSQPLSTDAFADPQPAPAPAPAPVTSSQS
ncbi:MAG: hypothetical protein QOD69_672 [Solirubrobacteraceae bacterium]|jgi:hypothetical protein|nr:hypothetical protein [Solirubrobacteraceae bacterium]